MIKRRTWSFTAICIGLLLLVTLQTGCMKIVRNADKDRPSSSISGEELLIRLERTACFGKCPVYSLMIKGDGTVIYSGVDFVQTRGIQETTIPIADVNELVLEFEKADYFSLDDSYTKFGKSDMPSVYTSITLGGISKSVEHYLGDLTAPKELTELEDKIDEIVNSDQWIK